MKLLNIKLSLIRDNNIEGILVIEKIEKCVKLHNISINKAITYLLTKYLSNYLKRILDICRAVYPYDGEIDFNKFIKQYDSYLLLKNIYYKTGNFKKSSLRELHEEDIIVNNKKIGILKLSILKNNINKVLNIANEIINPNLLVLSKKVIKKRKKRID